MAGKVREALREREEALVRGLEAFAMDEPPSIDRTAATEIERLRGLVEKLLLEFPAAQTRGQEEAWQEVYCAMQQKVRVGESLPATGSILRLKKEDLKG